MVSTSLEVFFSLSLPEKDSWSRLLSVFSTDVKCKDMSRGKIWPLGNKMKKGKTSILNYIVKILNIEMLTTTWNLIIDWIIQHKIIRNINNTQHLSQFKCKKLQVGPVTSSKFLVWSEILSAECIVSLLMRVSSGMISHIDWLSSPNPKPLVPNPPRPNPNQVLISQISKSQGDWGWH